MFKKGMKKEGEKKKGGKPDEFTNSKGMNKKVVSNLAGKKKQTSTAKKLLGMKGC